MSNNPNISSPNSGMVPINPGGISINASPQMHSAAAPAAPPAPQQHTQVSHAHELSRIRNLITLLRESLANLCFIAASHINNAQMDNSKAFEQVSRFDKAFEDFLAVCNQIELCLRTILECYLQTRDSHNYLPFQVSKDFMIEAQVPENNAKSYAHYLTVIKKQVNFAKAIYDILSDTAKQIKQNDQIMMPTGHTIGHQMQQPSMSSQILHPGSLNM